MRDWTPARRRLCAGSHPSPVTPRVGVSSVGAVVHHTQAHTSLRHSASIDTYTNSLSLSLSRIHNLTSHGWLSPRPLHLSSRPLAPGSELATVGDDDHGARLNSSVVLLDTGLFVIPFICRHSGTMWTGASHLWQAYLLNLSCSAQTTSGLFLHLSFYHEGGFSTAFFSLTRCAF